MTNLSPDNHSLFTSTGGFQPLPAEVLDHMSHEQLASYQAVHESFDALFEIERECVETERALRDTVTEMRSVEAQLAKLPKMSHVDLVKAVIKSNRRHA